MSFGKPNAVPPEYATLSGRPWSKTVKMYDSVLACDRGSARS
jgi:hypothetical protein